MRPLQGELTDDHPRASAEVKRLLALDHPPRSGKLLVDLNTRLRLASEVVVPVSGSCDSTKGEYWQMDSRRWRAEATVVLEQRAAAAISSLLRAGLSTSSCTARPTAGRFVHGCQVTLAHRATWDRKGQDRLCTNLPPDHSWIATAGLLDLVDVVVAVTGLVGDLVRATVDPRCPRCPGASLPGPWLPLPGAVSPRSGRMPQARAASGLPGRASSVRGWRSGNHCGPGCRSIRDVPGLWRRGRP